MKLKLTFLTFLIIFFTKIYSNPIDSLLKKLKSASKNEKIEIYLKLAQNFKYKNTDTAILFYQKALKLAKKLKSHSKVISIYHQIALMHLFRTEFNDALKNYKQALSYAQHLDNDTLLALCYHKVGNGFYFKDQLDSAMFYYLKSLEIRKKINDIKGLGDITNNLGVVYRKIKNYQQAIYFFKQAEKYYSQINDTADKASALNNIGVLYWNLEKYDSAQWYLQKATKLAEILKDSVHLANRINNLGVINRDIGNYQTAKKYFFKAYKIFKSLNMTDDYINVLNNLGSVYLKLKNYDSAQYYLFKAKQLAQQYNLYRRLRDIYLYIQEYFKEIGKFDSAYNYLLLFHTINDSLYQEDIAKQLDELRTKYETATMEKELIIKDLNLKKAKTVSTLLVIFTTIFLFMSIWLFILFRRLKKANNILQQQKQEILQQKEEILTQAEQLKVAFDNIQKQKEQIEKQNQTIKQINKKLTDSIISAQKIQEAMLPFEENFSKYFDFFLIYKPRDIVSGDFYWFSKPIEHNGHKYIFAAVVDCTGHGVPGAFMSMIGIRMIGEFINEHKILSPAQVLENMDKLTINALKQDISNDRNGMDICLVRFEKTENQLNIAFAGAKRDLYYYEPSQKQIITVKGTRRTIGGGPKKIIKPFENKEFTTSLEAIFYLTTDGFIDQNNKERKRLGTPKFLSLLEQIAEKPLEQQKKILEEFLEKWMEGTEQRDDITVLALKVKKI